MDATPSEREMPRFVYYVGLLVRRGWFPPAGAAQCAILRNQPEGG